MVSFMNIISLLSNTHSFKNRTRSDRPIQSGTDLQSGPVMGKNRKLLKNQKKNRKPASSIGKSGTDTVKSVNAQLG